MKNLYQCFGLKMLVLMFLFFTVSNANAQATHNVPGDYATIQAAIDASSNGDTIKVFPGTYNSDVALNRDPSTGGAGANNFNIFVNKSVTIEGVDNGGNVITNYSNVAAYITGQNDYPDFGTSAFFVQAANVTIQGLDITTYQDFNNYNGKAVEVSNDNVTIKYCAIHAMDQTACIYIEDGYHYNSGTDVSAIQSYLVQGCLIDGGGPDDAGIQIADGAGWSGSITSRTITGNTLSNTEDAIVFAGPGDAPWDLYPVGAATITNNNFSVSDRRHVIAWGVYNSNVGYGPIPWNDIVYNNGNVFDKAAITWHSDGITIRTWDSDPFYNITGIYSGIQRYAINKAQSGDIVKVLAGSYTESLTMAIPLTIKGANAGTAGYATRVAESIVDGQNGANTCLFINANNVIIDGLEITGGGGEYNSGIAFNGTPFGGVQIINNFITGNVTGIEECDSNAAIMHNLFDGNNLCPNCPGAGAGIYTDFLSHGLTIVDNEFRNHLNNSAVVFGASVANNHQNVTFSQNYIHNNNANNSMVYCVGINGGIFSENTITQPGTRAIKFAGACTAIQVLNNFLDNNGHGVRIQDDGYGLGADNNIDIHNSSFNNCSVYAIENDEAALVNATCNWYNSTTPATIAGFINGPVNYTPWLISGTDGDLVTPGFQPSGACSAPCALVLSASSTVATCPLQNNGTASVSVTSGGSGPYTYSWTSSPVQTTATATGLAAGTYNVTVTDANGCTATATAIVSNSLAGPVHNTNTGLNYCTIQSAINDPLTLNGHTITVDAGTYNENVVLTKRLTIRGAGNTIGGTVISNSGTIVTFYPGASTSDRTILDNVRISGGTTGISSGSSGNNYITISNVVSTGNSSYGLLLNTIDDIIIDQSSFTYNTSSGIKIPSAESVTHMTVTNSHFDYNTYGWYADANSSVKPNLDNVSVSNSSFDNNSSKGLYTERLSNALFNTVSVQNSGVATGPPTGMDINLKWKAYSNIELRSVTVSGSGGGSTSGAGVNIKGRNDAPSYNSIPASLAGLIINNCNLASPGIYSGTNLPALALGNNISDVTFSGTNTFTGTGGGLIVYTDNATPTIDLGTSSFDGGLASYIALGSPRNITATSATFNGSTGAGMGLADLFTTEDKILHAIDVTGLGFVTVNANNDYVTVNSFYSPATTTPSIQRGVDAASSGWTVNVAAGTYVENITINKEVTISGAGQGITTIYPAASGPTCGGSLCNDIIIVQANNVTIHGLTCDGNNPNISSGVTRGGVDIDAANGIVTDFGTGDYTNLTVHHVTVKNIYRRGIYSTGQNLVGLTFNFHDNIVQNVQGDANAIGMFNFSNSGSFTNNIVSDCNDAISSNWSTGTTYSGNTVTNSASGIHTDNNGGSGGIADVITGNTVTGISGAYGIWVYVPYLNVQVSNNSVTNCYVGLGSLGQYVAALPSFTGNTSDGNYIGVYTSTTTFYYQSGNSHHSFTNNFVANNTYGFYIEADSSGYTNTTTANNNSITGNSTQVAVDNTGTLVIDMTCNWWGTSNPATIYSSILGNVSFTPYLDYGTDNDLNTLGFQPVPNSCVSPTSWYVNDNSQAGDVYTTAIGNDANPGTTNAPFLTISHAISVASTSDTIYVDAGIYAEDIDLTKSLTITGANSGINPNTGVRGAESIIRPATSNPDVYSNTEEINFYLEAAASGTTIDGFTFDGNNPNLTHADNDISNGIAIDACEAIVSFEGVSNLTIQNNIIKNTDYSGIDLYNYNNNGAATTGNLVANNEFNNILDSLYGSWGIGVLLYNNCYTKITNNVIHTRVGIQTGNFYNGDPGNSRSISNNTIESSRLGIWHNLAYPGSPFTIADNTITTLAGSVNNNGIEISSLQTTTSVIVSNNNVTGAHIGVNLWNCPTSNTVTVSGGILTSCDIGVLPNNYDGYNSDADPSAYILDGVTINGSVADGIFVKDNPASAHHAVSADIKNCTINGSAAATGILVSGAAATASIHHNAATITGASIGVDINAGSSSIDSNKITLNGTGVRVSNGGQLTSCTENFITTNTGDGILVAANAGAITNGIHSNDLSGNGNKDIDNQSGTTINATCNWYGSNVYTTVTTDVNGPLTYTPYLSDGTDLGGDATNGFQPSVACSAPCALMLSTSTSNATCPSQNNGTASVSVTGGGSGSYTYSWTSSPVQTTATATGLAAGIYTVTVTDANNGCTATATATVSNSLAGPVHNINTGLNYCTIQAAINDPLTLNGHTITVDAGTYVENVVVSKELTINGAGQGLTIVEPAVSNPNPCAGSSLCGGAASNVFLIQANNVTIENLTVEGDNPSLTGGINFGGANIDARNGIITDYYSGDWTNLTVQLVTVKDIYLRGIYTTYDNTPGNTFNFNHNTVQNVEADPNSIGIFNFGNSGSVDNNSVSQAEIAANWSTGTTFTNNTVTNSAGGIHTDNNGGFGGVADGISGNNVSNSQAGGYGIWVFAPYANVSVDNNTVQNVNVGMACLGQSAPVTPVFFKNKIDGQNKANSTGMYVTTSITAVYGSTNVSASFNNNYVINNTSDGLVIESEAGYSLSFTAHDNSITGNSPYGAAINNLGGTFSLVDMTCNWWGNGTDAVSSGDTITWIPLLTGGTDGGTNTPGFAPTDPCVSPTQFYVNDEVVNGPYTSAAGNDANTGTVTAPFATIQHAINTASAGDTIYVDAGTFTEDIYSNKQLFIRGSNYSTNPNTASRIAESIIHPATYGPDPYTEDEINIYLDTNASGTTIDGFTIDGDNPAFDLAPPDGPAYTVNGATISASEGITTYYGLSNLTVSNNIIINISYAGVDFDCYYNGGTVTSGNTITNNLFDNMLPAPNQFGIAALIYDNAYANINDNVMTRTNVGIQTGNFTQADPGSSHTITTNTIQTYGVGIFHNLQYLSATSFNVINNTITKLTGAPYAIGMLITSFQGNVGANISNNSVTGCDEGIDLWNCPTTNTITVQGGIINNCAIGIFPNNYDGYISDADASAYILDGVTINGSVNDGIFVKDNTASAHHAVSAEVKNCTINGSAAATGILVSGAAAFANIHHNAATITGAGIGVDINAGSSSIDSNKITLNGTGVRVSNGGQLTSCTENFITTNTGDGILVAANAGAIINGIHNNDLSGNAGKDINNQSATNISATCNWYGSNVYTTVTTDVNGPLTYAPYLSDGTDLGGDPTNGFQPSVACSAPCVTVIHALPDVSTCDSYAFSSPWSGSTTSTCDSSHTYIGGAINGCDSTVTLHVVIRYSSTSSNSATACGSYVWNNTTYTTGGDKTYHTTNAAGCDSAATLHLTIITPTVHNITTGLNYCTIQSAINDLSTVTGDTITVDAGIYTESINITKGLTLLGPNAHTDCSGVRGAEANIIGIGGSNDVAVKIASDNVSVNGFSISDPTGSFGVSSQGRSNITVTYNIISNIGNNINGSGPSDGIQIESNVAANNVNLTYNCISNIRGGQNGATNGANGSGNGIGINSTTSNFNLSGLTISYNRISSVSASTTNGTGGKGAYGIIINIGASGSGKAVNPSVSFNTIDGLNGRWSHGVGLEGNTQGAIVNNNDIKNFTSIATDNVGVTLQGNPSAGTVQIHDNSFTNMLFAIGNDPGQGQVDAKCNWYGVTAYASIMPLITGNVDYSTWLTSNGNSASPGFAPTGSCNGSAVVIASAVPTNILCGPTTGSILVTWSGGLANYTVAWTGTSTGSASSIAGTSYSITPLLAGTYNITVTDADGSTATASAAIQYLPVTDVTNTTYYPTIQAAITAANPNDVINVCAGIYAEDIDLNKSLTIIGANSGINPNTGVRGAESIIRPATSNPDVYSNTEEINFYLEAAASGTTIDGFTFDGNNPNLTHADNDISNGIAIDACEAIVSFEGVSNLTIQNNIIKNTDYSGIDLYNYNNNGAATTGNLVANNEFNNILDSLYGSWGIGVLLYNNCYTKITNNVIHTRVGIQTGNFYNGDPGNSRSISNNTIESSRLGIWHNLAYPGSPFTIADNTITTPAGSVNNNGIEISSLQTTTSVIVSNNNVTGAHIGVNLWNCPTSNTVTVSGGILTSCDIGVLPNNYDGYNSDADPSAYILDGVTINGSVADGIFVKDNPASAHHAVSADIKNCTINGSAAATGILVSGAAATASIHHNAATITGASIGVDINAGSSSIDSNKITLNGTGVRVSNGGQLTSCTENFITTNTGDGILVATNAGAITNGIHSNDLSDNGNKDIDNQSGTTINATCNWYGSNVYTTVTTDVNGPLTYTPYLSDGTDLGGDATNGFQPSASCSAPCVTIIHALADINVCDSYVFSSPWTGSTTSTCDSSHTYSGGAIDGCDSTVTLHVVIRYSSTSSTSVTACDSYAWHGNTYTVSGTHTFDAGANSNGAGCDSVATLVLMVNYSSTSSTSVTACDSYSWNNSSYTTSGIYAYDAGAMSNSQHCDSVATLVLTVNYSSTSSTSVTACDSYSWNNSSYTTSGTYTYDAGATSNSQHCDSVATLVLTVNYSSTSSTSATACDTYTWNGTAFTTSGTHTFDAGATSNSQHCDSVATLHLTVNYSSASSSSATSCNSYVWNSSTYTTSGSYTYHSTNAVGCDSAATLNLTIHYSSSSTQNVTACTYYYWPGTGGSFYFNSGTYHAHLTNAEGCDSAMTLNLTIGENYFVYPIVTACDSFVWNGTTYTSSSNPYYYHDYQSVLGCDSSVYLSLTINHSSLTSFSATACDSYTLSWGGSAITTGSYSHYYTNISGCDSLVTANVTINYSNSSAYNVTSCDSYHLPWDGTIITSGVYRHHYTNVRGCDSLVTANVTINNSNSSSFSATACDSYTLPWGGSVSSSGSYTHHYTNVSGCDSLVTANVTINYSSSLTSFSATACDSYTLSWGGSVTTTGSYSHYYTNVSGCDSLVTANVTINYSSSPTSYSVTACDSYHLPWDGFVSSSGNYSHNYTNVSGCDSLVTANVTINNSNYSSFGATACNSYTLPWGGSVTTTGSYSHHYTNISGCDSLVTANVIINYSSSPTSFSATACDSYMLSWGGSVTTTGSYSHHYTNISGCDSLVTANVTINYSNSSSYNVTSCDSYHLPWDGTIITSGVYTHDYTNISGCDSLVTAKVTINFSSSPTSFSATACDSYTLPWGGSVTTTGSYSHHYTNISGCDSLVTANVTIKYSSMSSTSVTACDSYTWNGTAYTTSGSKTFDAGSTSNSQGCDSVATLVLTITHSSTSSTSVTACYSYIWNGTAYTTSGTRTFDAGATSNSQHCDSVATLVLTITHSSTSSTSVTACDSYTWNGTAYTTNGTRTFDAGATSNSQHCDSVATLVLTITHSSTSSTSVTACDSYTWNGTAYTTNNTYTYDAGATSNSQHCDSVATLILTITHSNTSSTSVTACDSYTWNNSTYTVSGTHTFDAGAISNAAGCDSVATLVLTINYSSTSSTLVTACDSYAWNNNSYTTSGTYTFDAGSTSNAAGCDSVATLVLTINHSSTSSTSVTACDSYTWNGTAYTTSGTRTFDAGATSNSQHCDSVATLLLTINHSSTSSTSVTACDSYTWNGTAYTTSGTRTFDAGATSNSQHCDSVATLVLTITHSSTSSTSVTACDSYTWNGTAYTASGTHTFDAGSHSSTAGCDSVATLVLTINYSSTSSTPVTACDSYAWNNNSYTTSGTYTFDAGATSNAAGCDSVAALVLTINYSSTSSTSVTACDSYTWNGTVYTTSGSKTFDAGATSDSQHCDSVATLVLTITHSSTSSTSVTSCDSYTWNGTAYTTSGTHTFDAGSHSNAAGCDSVATLVLTITYSSTSSTSVTACDSYTWNGTAYTTSGSRTFDAGSQSNAAGCDSVATLVLTINHSSTSNTSITACDSYTWNGTSYTTSGNKTFDAGAASNAQHCDSVATLILTLIHSSSSDTTAVVANSYTWRGNTYTASGNYTYDVGSHSNASGCDSVIILHLAIFPQYITMSTDSCVITDNKIQFRVLLTNNGDSIVSLNSMIVRIGFNSAILNGSPTITTNYAGSSDFPNIFQGTNGHGHWTDSYTPSSFYMNMTNSTADYTGPGQGNDLTPGSTKVLGVFNFTSSTNFIPNIPVDLTWLTTSGVVIYVNNSPLTTSFNSTPYRTLITPCSLTTCTPPVATAGSNSPVCAGTDLTLNSSATAGNGPFTYAWAGPNNFTSASENPTISAATTSAAGTYTVTITNACGSSGSTTLVIFKLPTSSSTSVTNCDSYSWNGSTYSSSGTYTFDAGAYSNAAGCDSVATLVLTITHSSTSSTSVTACGSYTWNNSTYTVSGTHTFDAGAISNAAGCDSVATLVLTINYSSTSSTLVTACDSYAWNNNSYTTSGTYTFDAGSTSNAAGCDSVATLVLTINHSSTSSTSATACDSYTWNGTAYTTSGTRTFDAGATSNSQHCDSVATLLLTINHSSTSSTSVTACDSYTWNGTAYTTSGTRTFDAGATSNSQHCDSVATLVLTITHSSTSSTSVTACDSYTWNGTAYTASGTHTFDAGSHSSTAGCDSVATLVLTINYSSTSSTPVTACDSYAWNNNSYTTSGTYTFDAGATSNAAGCDSVAALVLTINYSSTSSTSVTACDSYTWNGTVYTTSGSKTFDAGATSDSQHCDSVATLVLTITHSSTSSTSVTSCDSYTWNGTAYTTSGTHTFDAGSHSNAAGCDSVATLVLTITYSSTSSTSVTACDSYTWNGTAYTTSGSRTFDAGSQSNAAGCDSVATLVLTINHSSTSNTSITACDSYTWNGTSYTTSGNKTFDAGAASNAQHCDSVATLILTLIHSSSSDTTAVVANSYTWRGNTYTASGNYTYDVGSHSNASGCDSVIILHLAIFPQYITMSTDSCVITDNKIQFRVLLTNNGDSIVSLNSMIVRIGFNSAILNGSPTITTNYAGSSDFPNIFQGTNGHGHWTDSYTPSSFYMNMTNSTADYTGPGQGNDLTPGSTKVLGVFNFTSSTNFIPNIPVDLTWLTTSGVVIYVNNSPLTTSFNSTPYRTLITPCSLTTCTPPVATAGSNSPVCAGTDLTLNSSATAGNGPFTYAWAGPNNFTSASENPTISAATTSAAGTYTVTITNACGSSGSTTLVIFKLPTSSGTSVTNCDSYSWNGSTYSSSGTYTFDAGAYSNAAGCDSVATLVLTITHSSTSSTSVTACGSYTWNNSTYTVSGTHTFDAGAISNAAGCDSVATLVLTINYSSTSSTLVTACDSYAWNNNSYTTSGTYTFDAGSTSNAAGCDSVATLVLTINYSSSSSLTVDTCGPYVWNGTTYTMSGTYTFAAGPNAASCDSTAILHLTTSPCIAVLHAKLYLQGPYIGGGTMNPKLYNEEVSLNNDEVDTIYVSLVDSTILANNGHDIDGATVATGNGVLHVDGSLTVVFQNVLLGHNYYLRFNSPGSSTLETWSALTVTINPVFSYDFTTSASQAYGNIEADLGQGNWGLYTGDDNQDGYIDPFDFPAYDIDNSLQIFGEYVNTDFNGDGYVDPFDFPVFDLNNSRQIVAIIP